LYRVGASAEADELAATLERSSERDVASQACFLRGLIADDRNDVAALEAALRCASRVSTGAGDANASELSARIALKRGDAATAEATAEKTVDLRRDLHDDRGIARSLALAGAAARQAGSAARAASFYLRAARSAAAQGDAIAARQWFQTAVSLSDDADVRAEAERALSAIDQ
jgi:hypothetical protein